MLLLLLGIALSLPPVQTRIGQYVTEQINKDYGTDIQVKRVAISIFGGVKLRQVLIRDHHKDTLIFANRLSTNIRDYQRLIDGDLLFGKISTNGLLFHLKTYKGEKNTNLDHFLELFETGEKSSGRKFLMQVNEIVLHDGHFMVTHENRPNPKDADFCRLDGRLKNFQVYGPEVKMDIKEMAFLDYRGLYVRQLSGNFIYDKEHIKIENMDALTQYSLIKGDVLLTYNRKDFVDFNNKVKFDIKLDQALINTNDIYHFYQELASNKTFAVTAHITGTLNDLTANSLNLKDNSGSEIVGDVRFKNLFGKDDQQFYMKGRFDRVASTYKNLVDLLPNVLGKKLPTSLAKIGGFTLVGTTEVSTSAIEADFVMDTNLGGIQAYLVMTDIDNIDRAQYNGNLKLQDFNIGRFLEKHDLGIVSLDLDIEGEGFKQEFLNTSFSGDIYKIRYKDYLYRNILVNGSFKNPTFEGKVFINDPNLFMDFKGEANLGKKDIAYDFEAQLDYANLKNMRWVTSDSISVLKGHLLVDVNGNNLDDLKGNVYISNASYQNGRNLYHIDDVILTSQFSDDGLRTITMNAPEMMSAKIVGRYKIDQIQPMIENSLGSLYTNYRPNKIQRDQFMEFEFDINNQIVDLFYPDVVISDHTKVDGKINSVNNEFKLNLNSAKISAFNNELDNINLHIDNLHPIYNAQIEIDSIKNKTYQLSDFSLFNVTSRDTLFMNSEFKGGKTAQDQYKLNFYHTIDPSQNVVLGFLNSEIKFKNNFWYINEHNAKDNKIIADRKLKDFEFDRLSLTNGAQCIQFDGQLKGPDYKELDLSFQDVNLAQVTPELEGFEFGGLLNGNVHLRQNRTLYQPSAAIEINELVVNQVPMGQLHLDLRGDQTFKKFLMRASLDNDYAQALKADGTFDKSSGQNQMNMNLRLDRFNLSALDKLLSGDAISNIKGFASGNVHIGGTTANPDVNGRLYTDETSMTIPYLNVNYLMDEGSIVDVTETQFIIPQAGITDTKHKTKGYVSGQIQHNKFADWALDLKVWSNNLLALDTQDSDDAMYYGTAFIDGSATIAGPTSALVIKAKAKSAPGTTIKVPINNMETTSNRSYIHFLSAQEKYNQEKGIVGKPKNYEGLELDLDFDLNTNAEVEVILDKNTGHGLKTKGEGGIRFGINTLGKFNMWGNYMATEGIYHFKYGGVIDKKFKLKKGGTISWEGDPTRAVLNMEAVYSTTANPAVLLENPSINKKVPVEVVVGVRGNLMSPEPDFTINFPTVSSVLKSEIQYKLDDKDVRNTQALYLLSSGTFLSPEGVSQSDFAGNLFETASGLIGDIFQDPDSQIQFGINYQAADRRPGTESDGRVGVTVSTQVSDRISINGKVGVPVGGVNESAIVGDVEVQYRVNEDGTLNLRVFNRENDITYLGQGIGYTQGIGFSYEVDFDTFKELVRKIFNVTIEVDRGTDVVPDSDYIPDGMHFNSPKDKKKDDKPTTPSSNQEAIPTED